MAVPALNPVFAPVVVCPTCKSLINPEVQAASRKGMVEVRYVCVNEKTDCRWVLTLSQQHVMGDMVQLKDEELEKRRAVAKAAADLPATQDAKIRRLIMLLPHIEALLEAVAPDAEEAEQPAETPDGPKKPAPPVEVPEPVEA